MGNMNFRNKIWNTVQASTFNDMILLPGWTVIEPEEANVVTNVTPGIKINIPLVSSPMDTVTEAEMAIALAHHGGLGFIHRNCDIETQLKMVKRVKRAESYIMTNIITISPEKKVAEAVEIMERENIHGLPVVNGDNNIIGICTWRDVRFADNDL